MSNRWIQISPLDNVAVALVPLAAGEQIAGVTLGADVPAGHKLAIEPIAMGDSIVKYGYPIGAASAPIAM